MRAFTTERPTQEQNAPEGDEAFEETSPDKVMEVLDGERITSPRLLPPHSVCAARLGMKLGGAFELGQGGPGGWTILDEPTLRLGPIPDILVPDLAGYRDEFIPEAGSADGAPKSYDVAPEWVCEVLSEPTERIDRAKKMRIYRREEVAHVWLVNPTHGLLEVYRLHEGRWVVVDVFEGEATVRAEPFEAITLDLGLLWGA